MVVAADTDRVTKAAFMIPAQALIKAWPELAARRGAVAGSEAVAEQRGMNLLLHDLPAMLDARER
jgi:hypothetical protein